MAIEEKEDSYERYKILITLIKDSWSNQCKMAILAAVIRNVF